MVISGDHVFCPQINEGDEVDTGYFLDIALVAFRDGMGGRSACHEKQRADDEQGLEDGRAENAAAASEET